MRYDPDACALSFASKEELEAFHLQLSGVVRSAMVEATRHIEDPHQAKAASSEVVRDLNVLLRTLNVLRAKLPRRAF